MHRLLGRFAFLAAALVAAIIPLRAETSRSCWRPAELRARPGEERIAKNIAGAYVRLPATTSPRRPPLPAGLRGALRRVDLPRGIRRIALTFDLCEQPYEIAGYQGDIVDFLRDRDIAATFFAGGKWLLTHAERASQLMSDDRFEIANHAWEHRNLRLLSGARLAAEIDGPQRAYADLRRRLAERGCPRPPATRPARPARPGTLADDITLFRFPFGACNAAALEAVNDRGLIAVQWDVSAGDPWRGQTVERMVTHVVKRTRPGSILIFHANGRGWKTGQALPRIVDALSARGYEFVTISELLATPGARPRFTSTCYDSRPGDADRYDDLSTRLETQYRAFYERVGGRQP
jgi:peptidoglycan/xylan/chitin deacetylase (PgdA/CDA1 family)